MKGKILLVSMKINPVEYTDESQEEQCPCALVMTLNSEMKPRR